MKMLWQPMRYLEQFPNQGMMRIIVVNVALFLTLIGLKITSLILDQNIWFEWTWDQVALSSLPKVVMEKPWTLLSYCFVHIDLFHLLFNMLFFYWFGHILKDFIGEKKLLNLYFLGGLAGGLAYLLVLNNAGYFVRQGPSLMNGASASVFAIVVAAARISPNYQVHLMFLGPVKIKYIALFYVLWSLIETTGNNAGGNIAHLGGACWGYFYGLQFIRGNRRTKPVQKPIFQFAEMRKKSGVESLQSSDIEDIDEEELNAILDKISKSGYESLSRQEKHRLFKASQKKD